MKNLKKFLSVLLVIAMTLAFVPSNHAHAATASDYISSTYASNIRVKASQDLDLRQFPTDSSSIVTSVAKGTTLRVQALHKNIYGNYWYKVQYYGRTAYIYAPYSTFVEQYTGDVTIASTRTPGSLKLGSAFTLRGNITCTYNRLGSVAVSIYQGTDTTVAPYMTVSASTSSKTYTIESSTLDNNMKFGSLPAGSYTIEITATAVSSYVESSSVSTSSTTLVLQSNQFVVTDSTSPNTVVGDGVNVSSDLGTITWATVAENVEFANVRIAQGTTLDTKFKTNVNGCVKNSIPYGVYLESTATTQSEATAEAKFVIETLNASNYVPDLPVWIAMTSQDQNSLSASTKLAIVKAFCDTLRASGFDAGLFTYQTWFEQSYTDTYYNTIPKWVSHIDNFSEDGIDYVGGTWLWQYTLEGTVDGINKDVGISHAYVDLPGHASTSRPQDSYTRYPSYADASVVSDVNLRSYPRGERADNNIITSVKGGTAITVTGLYENDLGEYWYQVIAGSNRGYMYATYVSPTNMRFDDVAVIDPVMPSNLSVGSACSVSGHLVSKYNEIGSAYLKVFSAETTSSAVMSDSSTINTQSFYIKDSKLDKATSFNELTEGYYTLSISARVKNYYIKDGELTSSSKTVNLYYAPFTVGSSTIVLPESDICVHDLVTDAAVAATCTQTGLTEGSHCSKCGMVNKAQTVTEALGHKFSKGSCTRCGLACEHTYENGVCTICSYKCTHNWSGNKCTDCGITCTHTWKNGTCSSCGYQCSHKWSNGVCSTCSLKCTHSWSNSKCSTCGITCSHTWKSGKCSTCGTQCTHKWSNGVCSTCSLKCTHSWSNSKCVTCGISCSHTWENGHCTTCEISCTHVWKNGSCSTCGIVCNHKYINSICSTCGNACTHSWDGGVCSICQKECAHSYRNGVCSTCGEAQPIVDYYLFGYINGASYACDEDSDNLGIYKFVNNQLTVTFTQASYVGVKTGDNATWYLTNGWLGENVTSATLFNSGSLGDQANKLYVPGNRQVTFTLKVNTNGTLTLSYTLAACNHSYGSDGYCTVCGETCPHNWNNGVCYNCGKKCVHTYANSVCTECGTPCTHLWIGSTCYLCRKTCTHSWSSNGTCSVCNTSCTHIWSNGGCTTCGKACVHTWSNGKCSSCGMTCVHSYTNGSCSVCGKVCNHNWSNGSCVTCGKPCTHTWSNGACSNCGVICGHSWTNGKCNICGLECTHSYSGGACIICGKKSDAQYYLFGYINGKNYACEEDNANVGEYLFVNGTLSAIFTEDSYVAVKTGDNVAWYMTDGWQGTDATSVKLYNTSITLERSDKLYVPGNRELTFTLVVNSDGTLTLSYVVAECGHSWTDGICGLCGQVCEHNWVDHSCTLCGMTASIPTLNLLNYTVSFDGEVRYNIYYNGTNLNKIALTDMGMITWSSPQTDGTVATAEAIIPGASADGVNYMVHSKGIPAKLLGDNCYFKIYAKMSDGTYVYTDLKSVNAKTYANSIFNKSTNADMKALCVAMLNYGAAAQTYFDHKAYSLMNAGLTDAQKAMVQPYNSSMVAPAVSVSSTKAGSFTKKGFGTCTITASFEGAFVLNYYLNTSYIPDGDVTLYYWTLDDFNRATVLTKANATGTMVTLPSGTDRQYWGEVTGIAAKELDQTVFVAAVYTSGGVEYTTSVMNYSMGRYCVKLAGDNTSAQQELAQATAVYGYYAKQYFANLATN